MSSRVWSASGARRGWEGSPGRGARPSGSWALAFARAREAWDDLAGPPSVVAECDCGRGGPVYEPGCAWAGGPRHSEAAAAAILATALGLWGDSAASIAGEDDGA